MTNIFPRISLTVALLALACGPEPASSSTDADTSSGTTESTSSAGTTVEATTSSTGGTTAATTDASSSGTTLMPDPDYVRECKPGDYVCTDPGCPGPLDLLHGTCFKPCTPEPGKVGEPDPECDEPERPFCGQIGLFEGGDYNCNGCVHICVATPDNTCEQPFDACPAN